MSKWSCLLLYALVAVFAATSFLPSAAHEQTQSTPEQSSPEQSSPESKQSGNINFKDTFKKVYAFGGSSTDSGNARIMGLLKSKAFEKLEAGSDDPTPFWAAGSTKNLDRNGLCDGNLMIDFLCESLGLPKLEPYKKRGADFSHGANFAIAGSTVVKKAKSMFHLWWKNLPDGIRTQLHWFDSFFKIEKKPNLDDALFWLGVFGADDYAEAGKDQNTANFQGIANLNVELTTNLIRGLSDVGARFLVVQGLPPLGCIPAGLSVSDPNDRDKDGCSTKLNAAVMYHNDLLQKKINDIQSQNPNITIIFADSYKAFMKVFNNYQRFHFTEPISACCGYGGGKLNFDRAHLCGTKESSVCPDAGKHINWDGIHFTAAMYQHMSSLFLFGSCSYPPFSEVRPKVMAQMARDIKNGAKKARKVAKKAGEAAKVAGEATVAAGATAKAAGGVAKKVAKGAAKAAAGAGVAAGAATSVAVPGV